jgi:pescadillo protein
LAKKIGRALGRNELSDAVRLDKNASRMTLDHLVKERYPTFVDALRDLDDALSMLFLFASLPSTSHVPPKTIALCQRLCLEFQHYLIVSRSLRKSFLSIKGIYYQATIQGQDIMWLVPYKFVQKMAGDIDFRIMATFIEFYTTLMGFVNYRLYTTVGLVYPPKFDSLSDDRGGELGAFTLQGRGITAANDAELEANGTEGTNGQKQLTEAGGTAQAEADKLALVHDPEEQIKPELETTNEALDSFEALTTQDADILMQPTFTGVESGKLFSDTVFFLSRESPKGSLEFILRAFGCNRIGWDVILGDGAFTNDEKDPRITHQVVDRPPFAPIDDDVSMNGEEVDEQALARILRVPGRTYVQPQWVWDCINQGKIIRPDLYAPGATLPPHLSPWVKAKAGVYDPTKALEEQEKEGEAELAQEDAQVAAQRAIEAADHSEVSEEDEDDSEEDEEDVEEEENSDEEVLAGEGMQIDISGDEEAEADATESSSEDDGVEDILSESEDEAAQYQRELEAEAAGLPVPAKPVKTSNVRKQKLRKEKAEKEELDRQRMMMSNKKRKLFDKMQFSNKKTDREAEKLRQKRRKLESQKAT